MKRIAITQSNYIPWKGYFDLIAAVDELVLLDNVQYTRRDWRNRNIIKTAHGARWLTIPVKTRGLYQQTIEETVASNDDWREDHWLAVKQSYERARCFSDFAVSVRALYLGSTERHLSKINLEFLVALCRKLGIQTPLSSASEYATDGTKTARLIGICRSARATHYLSGPAAKAYIEPEQFEEAGIVLEYMDYSGYPEYHQLHGTFDHHVTVLDLLFNEGSEAQGYLKYVGRKGPQS